ncbi:MAG TPA: efflux RND transporter permease subunit [Bryocella sp.]|nr:efflux RND transporter permease subunit [Bryocella sp.]
MSIVRLALDRPYTFIVLAILILIAAPVVIVRTPTDIFPNIDIPVVSVAWQYTGLSPDELEGRLTTPYEKALTNLVDNIQHIESTTLNGQAIIKIYLQPGASLPTANAQVSAASQYMLRQLPPGILPPEIINFSASSVPILQLGISGKGLSEQQLNDYASNFIRPQLVTTPGAVLPNVYGGKQRSIMVYLEPKALQAKGLAPSDVLNALAQQNVVEPGGTAKIGSTEYDIRLNSSVETIKELGDMPIRQVNGAMVYVRDVASVADGSIPQTNIVRQDGHRGVLITVLKSGTASTLSVVQGVLGLLPRVKSTLPPNLTITPLANQATFVRGSISGVVREGIIAAALTSLMILLFLGSWRSSLIIAISIPLSVLTSIILLSLVGETINIMTLGGLSLSVGILVDNATVTIENVERYLEEGHDLRSAILEGCAQITIPILVATLCICIVFVPMFFLAGVSRYLFVPFAEAACFAVLASFVLSQTLVPTMAMYLLKAHDEHAPRSRNILARFQRSFERGFERVRSGYSTLLERVVVRRKLFVPVFLGCIALTLLLIPFLGQNFFPSSDNGTFILHIRAKTGTRIEETARLCDEIEDQIRTTIPAGQMNNILDNIGLPYSVMNTQHATSGLFGAADADIMVSLNEKHSPTADFVRILRQKLPHEFPGTTFYFLPSDIVTQILNFGLPAPLDIQIDGTDNAGNRQVANHILQQLRQVPGVVDARLEQPDDYPVINLNVDRTKAENGGYTEKDVGSSVLNMLSGSSQLSPMFFLNKRNGVVYPIIAESPQYRIQSLQDLENIPMTSAGAKAPEILADVAGFSRSSEVPIVSHYGIRRTLDIYAGVQDRDLGAVANDVQRIVDRNRPSLSGGNFITMRGQVETMRSSYTGLLFGLVFSILLVYLLIVVNFQSWLDPFIIITALPAAIAGIILLLFLSHTTLSVPALMGAIMCMGVATANSILVVAFAKDRLHDTGDAIRSAIEAGATRFRPVLMTALAMIIGMIPMALGLGEGGEQNAPLGRAVIGGLCLATVATLIFVPSVFALLHGRGHSNQLTSEPAEADTHVLA